jgi:hypothetical protein
MRFSSFFRPGSTIIWSLAALMTLVLAQPAAAQWKWRDANGRVTASDLPPPREVPDKDILQRPQARARAVPPPAAPASAAPAASAPPVDARLEARKRAADEQQREKTKAEEDKLAAARAENCRRARNHLSTLDSGIRMTRTNDKGEREILDDKARADETRRAREVIASDCR